MLSSSPIGVAGRAAWIAVRASSSMGRTKPPASRTGGLLEGHDLKALALLPSSRQTGLPHGEAAMNDQGGSMCDGRWTLSFQALLRLAAPRQRR
jgi:hypothetical protein